MAESPDITRAIEIIDQRINSLKNIKQMLVKEFGLASNATSTPHALKLNDLAPNLTRKQQVIKFLRENGASKRIEIIRKSGVPQGSVACALVDRDTFLQTEDGKWDVREKESAPSKE